MDEEMMIPDRPIAFNRDFVRLGVGINGALMLSQAIYWHKRVKDENNEFWKTQAEWEDETGLTVEEQRCAAKKLVSAGFLEVVKKGVPARNHYKVNIHNLWRALSVTGKPNDQSRGNPTTGDGETPRLSIQRVSEITTEKRDARGLASSIPGITTGDQYQPDGNRPRSKAGKSPKQKAAFRKLLDIDPAIVYYREQAATLHGLSYLNRSEDLNAKMRKLFESAHSRLGDDLTEFIDWVLDKGGASRNYEPEWCMTGAMFRQFENREAIEKMPKTKKDGQTFVSFKKKGGEER